uniref:Uncharacterized protein n=1 Tax=Rhizobium rhizogenes TaxID=359 RepID=A0A7S5DSM6_RHIRH|nr:hypothetical protein pC5.7b_440 [Rhizobium rhizogenes]
MDNPLLAHADRDRAIQFANSRVSRIVNTSICKTVLDDRFKVRTDKR